MKLIIYQIDAFTSELFRGNPAAVIPLNEWLGNNILQNIAAENNLSETAFFVKENGNYHIRWMTPEVEVPLCGHATLASAFVIFNYLEPELKQICFHSKSGLLFVDRDKLGYTLNFPSNIPSHVNIPEKAFECFGRNPVEVLSTDFFLLVVFDSEDFVKSYKPRIELIKKLHNDSVIITSPGNEVDFVSRMFAPNVGIDEDPVTGSAHTVLTPYWSARLGKNKLHALQLSKRGGELWLENLGDRIKISGNAVLYMKGEIQI